MNSSAFLIHYIVETAVKADMLSATLTCSRAQGRELQGGTAAGLGLRAALTQGQRAAQGHWGEKGAEQRLTVSQGNPVLLLAVLCLRPQKSKGTPLALELVSLVH